MVSGMSGGGSTHAAREGAHRSRGSTRLAVSLLHRCFFTILSRSRIEHGADDGSYPHGSSHSRRSRAHPRPSGAQLRQQGYDVMAQALPVFNSQAMAAPAPANFDEKLAAHGLSLRAATVETLQVNVGKLCNQACKHCHVDASPARTEIMTRETVEQVITALRE